MINLDNIKRNDFSDIKNAIMPFNVLADAYGEYLAGEQLRLEHESYQMGEERFIKAFESACKRGEVGDSLVARPLLETLVPALSEAIKAFLAQGGRGRPHVSKKYLKMIDPDAAAFLAIKVVLMDISRPTSGKVNNHGAVAGANMQSVCMSIAKAIEEECRFGRIRDEEAQHFKNRVKPSLDKRQGLLYKREYMKAVEAGMIAQGELDNHFEEWPRDEAYHVGVKMLELIIESTGLCELVRKNAGNPKLDRYEVELTEEYADKLASRVSALAGISPVKQPCVVPPKPWTGVIGGGYWAKGRKPLRLIRTGTKRALMRYNDVDMPDVYKAINIIQNTAWKVNADVLKVANEIVYWKHCPVEDIPQLDKLDKPVRPEGIDEDEALLKKWKKNAATIYRKEKARQSRRLSLDFMMAQANKFAQYDAIWFPYTMDWRGRVYAEPMFNPQGNDLTKGLLTFANGCELGSEGAYWLAVHGSNCAGVDKVSLDDRVKWVYENEENILASAKNPLDCTWWAEQDSPFCFLAFCFEWLGYVESGRSEGYVSHLPLAFDGTCSGLQHFSAMLRDEVGGAAVNLLPADKPQDIYGIVAQKVNVLLERDLLNGTEDSTKIVVDKKTGEQIEKFVLGTRNAAKQWLQHGVNRSVTKRSVMTLAYGSKKYGFAEQIMEDTLRPAIDKGEGNQFTAPNQAAMYLAGLIWDCVSTTVIAAVQAMEWLQKSATLISSEVRDKKTKELLKPALPIHWTTPNGFPVWSEYMVQEEKVIDTVLFGNLRLQNKIKLRDTAKIDAQAQASGIAPNFIHSNDASHLQMTAVYCHDVYGIVDFAFIHDSFGCHAGKAHLLFKGVRETMVKTYSEHDVIAEFYEQFAEQLHESQLDKMPALPEKGNLDLNEILKSLYTFS